MNQEERKEYNKAYRQFLHFLKLNRQMKEKTYDEIVIDNANDVLNSPMSYPTYSKYGSFHTAELNTRSMWAQLKKAAEERIKESKTNQTKTHENSPQQKAKDYLPKKRQKNTDKGSFNVQ